MALQNRSALILSLSHGGNVLGTVVSFSINQVLGILKAYAQGALGGAAIGITAKDYAGTVAWYAGEGSVPVAETEAADDLTVTVQDLKGGGAQDYTVANMRGLDWSLVMSDRQFGLFSQNFLSEDAQSADGFSVN